MRRVMRAAPRDSMQRVTVLIHPHFFRVTPSP